MAGQMRARPVQVAVCGPADCTHEEAWAARRVGELLAARGAVVICGGGTGVMAAAAEGARAAGGLAVGILPGPGGVAPAADLDVAIATGFGEARNAVIAQSADAVIVVGGSWGTLSEVALAMRRGGVPVVTLGGWQVLDRDGSPVPGPVRASDPEQATELALACRYPPDGATMEQDTEEVAEREA